MAFKAGRGVIDLTLGGLPGLRRGATAAAGALQPLRRAALSLGKSLVTLGGVAGVAGLVLGVRNVVMTFATFEKAMSRVRALTGATEGEFAALVNTAKELGASTEFTAIQAAQAMSFFAQAGFQVDKIIGAMPHTLNLAAAGQLDMATAADIVAKIMSGMGIEAGKLEEAVDVLAKAFTTANTDLMQLGEAMKFVGPVAASAGKDLAETTAALMILSNAGIQASMAGTSLRKILLTLQSKRAATAFGKLGIEVFNAEQKMRPLADLVAEMVAAFDRLDPLKRAEMMALFGDRAGPGLQVLLDRGADSLRAYEGELEKAAGTASNIARIQMDNLAGSLIRLQSAWEGVKIEAGKEVAPVLEDLADELREHTDAVGAATKASAKFAADVGINFGRVVGGWELIGKAAGKALANMEMGGVHPSAAFGKSDRHKKRTAIFDMLERDLKARAPKLELIAKRRESLAKSRASSIDYLAERRALKTPTDFPGAGGRSAPGDLRGGGQLLALTEVWRRIQENAFKKESPEAKMLDMANEKADDQISLLAQIAENTGGGNVPAGAGGARLG
jgi:TP901 family phage tail tape measure protein